MILSYHPSSTISSIQHQTESHPSSQYQDGFLSRLNSVSSPYNELKHDYPNHQEIFTDGSKSSNKVSAAAVFLNSKLAFLLISSTQVIPIPLSDALLLFGTTSVPNGKLLGILSQTTNSIVPLHYSYSRKEQVIFNRLLISHTHLTHSYLLNKDQPPNCNYCKSLLTVEHILMPCSAYKNIREKHYSNPAPTHLNQHF